MTNEIQKNWYETLLDDCKTIIVERRFRAEMEVIECWHSVGERIVNDTDYQKHAKGNQEFIKRIANDLGVSKSTVYSSIKFYEQFPDISNALESKGKNISWHKIHNGLLENSEDKTKEEKKEKFIFDSFLKFCSRNEIDHKNYSFLVIEKDKKNIFFDGKIVSKEDAKKILEL